MFFKNKTYIKEGRILFLLLACQQRIESSEVSVGHSYNLIDIKARRILNVETASRKRFSVCEIGATPFFHANMYLHLQVEQVSNRYLALNLQPTFENNDNNKETRFNISA